LIYTAVLNLWFSLLICKTDVPEVPVAVLWDTKPVGNSKVQIGASLFFPTLAWHGIYFMDLLKKLFRVLWQWKCAERRVTNSEENNPGNLVENRWVRSKGMEKWHTGDRQTSRTGP
jgi:hypothetical protein